MVGRIKETSIQEVREKARLDDIISQHVTLRRAGPGTYKGLCPFHDEKTPSFNVNPSRGFYKCFGCGEGGDVIDFVMKLEGLSFFEAVERLGDKVGVQVQHDEGDEAPVRRGPGRGKLVEAHKVAAEFYAEQLLTADAVVARQFLDEKGFDRDAALHFGVGFSPRGGEDLYRHLRARGFSDEEVVTAGLVAHGRSHYDRFRGRLMWPIRESGSDVIGFGARRLFDDDRIEAKYLNTSETPIYKKSHVLYGIDLARKEMARTREAVIVEGYTDVMACHLAGITTAVATCGTAFGDDHA
ncbi:MAG: DNA primase, partial [Actinomycetes bacterium]